ncbi:MAG TPA: hypothetical protein QF753_11770 [Victivallales bacterium]|nr:hypothetical protein [Victivallales bacterium]
MQNITKYILFLFTSFIMICSVYADSLVEKVTVQNPYTVAYINLNKIYNSSLFKYTNEKLKDAGSNSVNQSDLYKKIIKTLKKHNLQESDFTEFASTVGLKNPNITSVDNVKKSDINFAFGFSLTKSVSFTDLENITKDIVKNESKVASSTVTYEKDKYIKIVSNDESFYLTTLPENKLIIGTKSPDELYLLINNIKNSKHIMFTSELNKIYSLTNKKNNAYIALALPNSITGKIPAVDNFNNEGINSVDSEIFKNITGAVLLADINTDLSININTFFKNTKAAKAFNLLLNQFLPTFKIMLFMSAKGPLPMLDTAKNSVTGDNVVNFHIKISKQDIKTLYKFANNKKGVESLSKIIDVK